MHNLYGVKKLIFVGLSIISVSLCGMELVKLDDSSNSDDGYYSDGQLCEGLHKKERISRKESFSCDDELLRDNRKEMEEDCFIVYNTRKKEKCAEKGNVRRKDFDVSEPETQHTIISINEPHRALRECVFYGREEDSWSYKKDDIVVQCKIRNNDTQVTRLETIPVSFFKGETKGLMQENVTMYDLALKEGQIADLIKRTKELEKEEKLEERRIKVSVQNNNNDELDLLEYSVKLLGDVFIATEDSTKETKDPWCYKKGDPVVECILIDSQHGKDVSLRETIPVDFFKAKNKKRNSPDNIIVYTSALTEASRIDLIKQANKIQYFIIRPTNVPYIAEKNYGSDITSPWSYKKGDIIINITVLSKRGGKVVNKCVIPFSFFTKNEKIIANDNSAVYIPSETERRLDELIEIANTLEKKQAEKLKNKKNSRGIGALSTSSDESYESLSDDDTSKEEEQFNFIENGHKIIYLTPTKVFIAEKDSEYGLDTGWFYKKGELGIYCWDGIKSYTVPLGFVLEKRRVTPFAKSSEDKEAFIFTAEHLTDKQRDIFRAAAEKLQKDNLEEETEKNNSQQKWSFKKKVGAFVGVPALLSLLGYFAWLFAQNKLSYNTLQNHYKFVMQFVQNTVNNYRY